MKGIRFMQARDLALMLARFRELGVDVPVQTVSPHEPRFLYSIGRTEFYDVGLKVVNVPEGSVIDQYGNVVPLRDLQTMANWSTQSYLDRLLQGGNATLDFLALRRGDAETIRRSISGRGEDYSDCLPKNSAKDLIPNLPRRQDDIEIRFPASPNKERVFWDGRGKEDPISYKKELMEKPFLEDAFGKRRRED